MQVRVLSEQSTLGDHQQLPSLRVKTLPVLGASANLEVPVVVGALGLFEPIRGLLLGGAGGFTRTAGPVGPTFLFGRAVAVFGPRGAVFGPTGVGLVVTGAVGWGAGGLTETAGWVFPSERVGRSLGGGLASVVWGCPD